MNIAIFLGRRAAPMSARRSRAAWGVRLLTAAVLTAALGGCSAGGGSSGTATTMGSSTAGSAPPVVHITKHLQGVVHGGQSPIIEAGVQVYAAGQPVTGAAVLLGTAITDASGNFTVSSFNCPSSTALIYVVASNGGVTSGAVNFYIKLMAALGPCGNLPNSIVINELTTVAAVYALNAFSNVNSSSGGGLVGCVDCTPSVTSDMTQLHGNTPAITNSFATAALLADVTTGGLGTFLPAGANCPPGVTGEPVNCSAVQKLTALANSLAGCVNSSGPAYAVCQALMRWATAGSTAPVETLEATLSIARNPGLVNIAGVYAEAPPKAVFNPGLAAAPTDWTIALNFTNGGLNYPSGIAIDASGNVWIANALGNSLTELSPTGAPLSPGGGFTGGALNAPVAIAIDTSGNVWVANSAGNIVSAFDSAGTAFGTTTPGSGGLSAMAGGAIGIDPSGNVWVGSTVLANGKATNSRVTELSPQLQAAPNSPITGGGLVSTGPGATEAIAVDSSGHVWVANAAGNDVAELSASGVPLSGANGFTAGSLTVPTGIAVDATGHVWIANYFGQSVTELSTVDGSTLSGANGFTGGGISAPEWLAIDGDGNVWVANYYASLTELNSSGMALSPATSGFTGGGMTGSTGASIAAPSGIAIDASGDVWVPTVALVVSGTTLTTVSSVVEFVGAAVPVVTPLVAQITPPTGNLTSISVTPTNPSSIAAGSTPPSTEQFTATGTYANGTTANLTGVAMWTSSNTAVATIAAGGLATAVASGTTTITASVIQNGTRFTSNTVQLTITAAMASSGANALAIASGGQIQLFNVSSSWTSAGSAPAPFATLSAPGVTSVAFDTADNLYYLASVVTPASVTFNKCAAPAYTSCVTVGASLPAASQWLAIDTNGNGYATEASTVVEFSLGSGPSANSPVVYTSSLAPSPAAFSGLAASPGPNPTLYVVEGQAFFGTNNQLYQCALPCKPNQQTNITNQVLQATVVPNSTGGSFISGTVFGPVAVGPLSTTNLYNLYVAIGDASTNGTDQAAPNAQPIVVICPGTIGASGSCIADSFAFKDVVSAGNISPFVGSVGVAADPTGNVYVAIAQGGYGSAVSAPFFFGFQPNGSQFGCSTTPSTCPVNLLPSLPPNPSSFDNLPYAMAIGPAGS